MGTWRVLGLGFRVSPKWGGDHFGGPHPKDCSLFGFILGVPLFREATVPSLRDSGLSSSAR